MKSYLAGDIMNSEFSSAVAIVFVDIKFDESKSIFELFCVILSWNILVGFLRNTVKNLEFISAKF